MQKTSLRKFLAGLLAGVMLASTLTVTTAFADGESGTAGSSDAGYMSSSEYEMPDSVENVEHSDKTAINIYNNLAGGDAGSPYSMYLERYKAERAKESIVLGANDVDTQNTTADVLVMNGFAGEEKVLFTPSTGITSFKVNVPETAYYAMRINYYPMTNDPQTGKEITTYTTIERTLFVDGHIPFEEARYFYFPRVWEYEQHQSNDRRSDGSYVFQEDASGNDVRPLRFESPKWQSYYLRDWLGYTLDPFEFYLTGGEHVISLEATREPMAIKSIELYPVTDLKSYSDFVADKQANGVQIIDKIDGGAIKIQGEAPEYVSNASLFPVNDRTSSLNEPQDPKTIKFNIVNSMTVNEWMEYKVTVPKEGLYTIAIRYRQNDLIGMFTSRRILINGEQQFKEAQNLRFKYDTSWQSAVASDGTTSFMFYLKEGENTITFETVLGEMTDYVYQVEQIVSELNWAYKKILQLTGPAPDANRDYGFNRLVPEAIEKIDTSAKELRRIAKELEDVTGELGDQVATLNTVAVLLEKMASSEYQIAPNFISYKSQIIALSNWLYAALRQPLKIDYFVVQGQNDALPKASANFFEVIWFELKAFVGSFFMDYTTVDFKSDMEFSEENTVEMWINSATATAAAVSTGGTTVAVGGRDGALVDRYLIDTYFTPNTGITVQIKIITTGLQEAILAGMGPDISQMTSTDTITWGLRNAVEALDEMNGFDEVADDFPKAAISCLQMTDAHGVFRTYGLPQTLNYYMMFYRSDILAENGVEVPKTWDDLYDILPALQNSDLEVGMPATLKVGATTPVYEVQGLEGLKIFLYQMGGQLFTDGGYRTALDENVALDAFEAYCDMFSKYRCSVEYDLTRFRTGEIPIYFGLAIDTYNTFMSYYDIRGLWKVAPLPGVEQADGSINCTSPVIVESMVIPRGATNPNASWEYMKWRVSTETQKKLAKENLAINPNPTVKYKSSSIDALLSQAWTAEEYEAFKTQTENLAGVPEYPGIYILKGYVNSAYLAVRNQSSDASDEMLEYIVKINREISRKRDDFKMDYYDVVTGEYHPGRYISEPVLGLIE